MKLKDNVNWLVLKKEFFKLIFNQSTICKKIEMHFSGKIVQRVPTENAKWHRKQLWEDRIVNGSSNWLELRLTNPSIAYDLGII